MRNGDSPRAPNGKSLPTSIGIAAEFRQLDSRPQLDVGDEIVESGIARRLMPSEQVDQPLQSVERNLAVEQVELHPFQHVEQVVTALDRLAATLARILLGRQRLQRQQAGDVLHAEGPADHAAACRRPRAAAGPNRYLSAMNGGAYELALMFGWLRAATACASANGSAETFNAK
mgnify:CR=1 FL=1